MATLIRAIGRLEHGVRTDGNALHSALINTSSDAEETLFSPAGTPAVLDRPELLSSCFLDAVANKQDSVIGELEWIVPAAQTCK